MTTLHPLLRAARAADAPRVADVLIDTRRAFMPYAPSAHGDAEVRHWVAHVLLPDSTVTVAEIDGRVIGLVATRGPGAQGDRCSWILQMAVDPALVGQGVGSQLLAHALRTLPWPIRLYTFEPNTGARRFYERHGFVAIEFGDGSGNEEGCPDVLYELDNAAAASR